MIDLGLLAREIVAKRVGILAGLPVALGVAVSLGLPLGASDQISYAVTSLLSLLGLLAGIFWARSGVTPADPGLIPTSSEGIPLVPIIPPPPPPLL